MSDSWTEQKHRWASIRAAFADHVYEASEENLRVFVPAFAKDEDKEPSPNSEAREGSPSPKTDSKIHSCGAQTFTDEQAIALLRMGLNDLLQIGATPAPVLAETSDSSGSPFDSEPRGEARESTIHPVSVEVMTDSRDGQTFTDEQAIALLRMGLNDLSGGNMAKPVTPKSEDCASPAQIITSQNGIFAGTVIGVKASATKDGITHVAFGPDAKTTANRLREKLK